MSKLPLIAFGLAAAALAGGIVAGLAVAHSDQSVKVESVAEYLKRNNLTPDARIAEERLPKAEVVGSTEHNFGHLAYQDEIKIKFEIKNTGGSELRIEKAGVSCGKCVSLQIPQKDLPPGVRLAPEAIEHAMLVEPGATAPIYVWFSQKNKEYEPEIAQTATVRTSDPRNRVIEFRITGKITKSYRVIAPRFTLGDITAGSGYESKLGVFGYGPEPLKIENVEFITDATDEDFKIRVEPMSKEEVDAELGATSGYNLVLTAVRPPVGRISHRLRMVVSNGDPPTMEIPIEGNVVGRIQVRCLNTNPRIRFFSGANVLDWSTVSGKEGAEMKFEIRARMKEGDAPLEYKIKEIHPSDLLQAEIGESRMTETAQVTELIVRIPPGSPPANYRSTNVTAKPSRIVIETNDPVTPEVVIGFRFGVE